MVTSMFSGEVELAKVEMGASQLLPLLLLLRCGDQLSVHCVVSYPQDFCSVCLLVHKQGHCSQF